MRWLDGITNNGHEFEQAPGVRDGGSVSEVAFQFLIDQFLHIEGFHANKHTGKNVINKHIIVSNFVPCCQNKDLVGKKMDTVASQVCTSLRRLKK